MTDSGIVRLGLAVAGLAALTVGATMVDASRRRDARRGDEASLVSVLVRLPAPALALSGGARWLREPALEEPGAAFDEGPAMLDADPADGVMAPPRSLWAREAR